MLGVQFAEEGGSDLEENLDCVKILGDKRQGLGIQYCKERKLVTSSGRAALGRTRECVLSVGMGQGLHMHISSCAQ